MVWTLEVPKIKSQKSAFLWCLGHTQCATSDPNEVSSSVSFVQSTCFLTCESAKQSRLLIFRFFLFTGLPAFAMPSSEVALELAQFGLKPQRSLIIITVLLAVTTIAVLLRFYVRIVMLKKFDLSDWLLLGALVCHSAQLLRMSPDKN